MTFSTLILLTKSISSFFFFNDTATTEIYTLSLHDALPIAYFTRYRGVKEYLDHLLAETRKTEVAKTLFGRIRPIPEINSPHMQLRNFAERTALNSPLQGTAADLIKLAMINIDRRLAEEKLEAKMILQVHDELLFEAPTKERSKLEKLVREEMEGVHKLIVPIAVEIGAGPNWRDLD